MYDNMSVVDLLLFIYLFIDIFLCLYIHYLVVSVTFNNLFLSICL
jgi:hypothetical protein